jgi:hypothetical protein
MSIFRDLRQQFADIRALKVHRRVRASDIPTIGTGQGGTGSNAGGTGSIQSFINGSGGPLDRGAIVILESGRSIETTNVSRNLRVIGVVDGSSAPYANGAETPVRLGGYHNSVLVAGVVNEGDYLVTSTTPGRAASAGPAPVEGAFARALSSFGAGGQGTVEALIFDPLDGPSGKAMLYIPFGSAFPEGHREPPEPISAHDHTSTDGSGVLTNDEHDGYSQYGAISAPASPSSNKLRLYARLHAGVTKLFYKTDTGLEFGPLGEGGGGGTSATIWMPDAPPATPGALDDEFADNSGGVPNGWTEVDFSNHTSVVEDEAGLTLLQVTHAGDSNAGIYKTIPSGDFTIWTKLSTSGVAMQNIWQAGLALWNNAASSTAPLLTFVLDIRGTQVQLMVLSWTAYNTFSTVITQPDISVDVMPTHIYLRIRRTGANYAYDASSDGLGWHRISTTAPSFTPAHVGPVIMNEASGTDVAARFAFFRYVNSDVGLTGLMKGNRR